MLKTVFSKLIAIFICILLLSFSIAGVTLYYLLDSFVLQGKVNTLEAWADVINVSILSEYIVNQNALRATYVQNALNSISNQTGTLIFVVDKDGKIVFSAPEIRQLRSSSYSTVLENLKFSQNSWYLPDVRQYNKFGLGKENIQETGDYYGLFKGTGTPWLTIGKQFKVTMEDGQDVVVGGVLINVQTPEIYRARWVVIRLFFFSAMISGCIATVLIYIFSLRLTQPLKAMKNAARTMASGEFKNRLTVTSQDEIGELANSFNYMAGALESLEEMRRGFIANVSHELRTPMTSIRGFIEGILDGTIPPEREHYYLTIVRDEIHRLNRLVNDLLDLARMESGEMKLTMRNFDVNELIRRCIIRFEQMLVDKKLEINVEFEQPHQMAYADTDAVERVVINLLHNAIKFTPSEGKIDLQTYTHKGKIYISIADTGKGITKEDLDHIWDRFYKSDKSRGMDKTGTGLGLSIVKSLINEQGEEIWVESEPEKGTRFVFTLSCEREM